MEHDAVYLRRMSNGNHLLAFEQDGVNEGGPAYVQIPPVYDRVDIRGGTGSKDVPREEEFSFGDHVLVRVILTHE